MPSSSEDSRQHLVLGLGVVIGIGIALAYVLFGKKKGKKALTMVYQPFKLAKKDKVSPNTFRFRFNLPSSNDRLGLPVGKHILLKFADESGSPISRPYTPVTSDNVTGYFDLVVKVYPQGLMSQHLANLNVGNTIDVRGPLGNITYAGDAEWHIKRRNPQTRANEIYKRTSTKLGMIAGGTGITPMYQVIQHILSHPTSPPVNISLIFANVTEDDILLREQLEAWKEEHSNFDVHFTLDRPGDNWRGEKGFVTADMIQKYLPAPSDDTTIFICGPPPMVKFMEGNMKTLNYDDNMHFNF